MVAKSFAGWRVDQSETQRCVRRPHSLSTEKRSSERFTFSIVGQLFWKFPKYAEMLFSFMQLRFFGVSGSRMGVGTLGGSLGPCSSRCFWIVLYITRVFRCFSSGGQISRREDCPNQSGSKTIDIRYDGLARFLLEKKVPQILY